MAPALAPAPLAMLVAAALSAGAAGRLADPTTVPAKLCADHIVRETCALVDPDAGASATPAALTALFASSEASVEAFWQRAGLPADRAASCADLCRDTTALLKSLGRRMPRSSDVGCYEAGVGEVACDLDLAPAAIQSLASSMADFPFSEDNEIASSGERHDNAEVEVTAFNYTVEEVAVRVAELFRIYPALDSNIEIGALKTDGPHVLSTPEQKALLSRRFRQAQAYLNIALRTFPANGTRDEATMYFGRPALVSKEGRTRIQFVLNSINNVLSNATFIYPGPACSPNVFAYVYPCTGGGSQEKDPRARFYVHLCDMFFKVAEEQICTLVHEASHHAMACTADVQYGAANCQQLAKSKPKDALRNADNFGYYIRQVAWTYGSF